MMNQHQILKQPQLMNQQLPAVTSQPLPPTPTVSQLSQQLLSMSHMNQLQMVSQCPMMAQNYANWTQFPPPMNGRSSLRFANPMVNMYGTAKSGRNNWKGKKPMEKSMDGRRKDVMVMANGGGPGATIAAAGGMSYKPPTLQELEQQNRLKARRFYARKKHNNRVAPYARGPRQRAPRNTTSFIIRAKKAGGIASLVSPYPVTPSVLPTPVFSPSREALVDMAKEEWGVDGYGTMKGLIRLRSSPGHETEFDDYEDEDEGGGSSESDVEEHLEVERRLDHDLSRFEMIYPESGVLENRVHDQDKHIAQLEEENLLLKDSLYVVERELGDLRRRLRFIERRNQAVEVIDEVVENVSENDSELRHCHLHARKGDEEVDSVFREGEASCFVAREGEPSMDRLGNFVDGAKEEVALAGDKGGALAVEQTTDTNMQDRVLKDGGSTGVKVEEEIDNNRDALEHESAGDLGMQDSDMAREDAGPDKGDDDEDSCAPVEGEVAGSGEALRNEQIEDLHMED